MMDSMKENAAQGDDLVDNSSSSPNPTPQVPPPYAKRKRGGRALRRRRRKVLEIQHQAEQALLRFQERGGGNTLSDATSPSTFASSFEPTASATRSTASSTISSVIIPDDRHQVWPAVLTQRSRLSNSWKAQDEVALVSQLGYLPGNVLQVTCYDFNLSCFEDQQGSGLLNDDKNRNNDNAQASPVAIQLYPIALRTDTNKAAGQGDNSRDVGNSKGRRKRRRRHQTTPAIERVVLSEASSVPGGENAQQQQQLLLIEPFPTIYWLTHPVLRVLISQLEVKGFGVEFERRLAQDPAAMESMRRAHQGYGQERKQLLLPEDVVLIQSRRWESALNEERGVAGIRNFQSVKCLHAHAAHYLSASSSSASSENNGGSDNVVGQWVMEEVEKLVRERKQK